MAPGTGGWCWRKVAPLLEAAGHTVLAPDLPGHGDDRTPTATVTQKSYTDRICQIAAAQAEPVILLGHSMGGIAITQAAENCTDKIKALVYMCAFLPRNGDSLMTWATQDRESAVNLPAPFPWQIDPSPSGRNISGRCFTPIARRRYCVRRGTACSPVERAFWRSGGNHGRALGTDSTLLH